MTREEWRQSLEQVARDPEAAPGPRVRALELIGRDYGWVTNHQPRGVWWRLLDRSAPTSEETP